MSHHTFVDTSKPIITGEALSPIEGDDVEIVEGMRGNPIPLNDDDLFTRDILGDEVPGEFYLLVAGGKGKDAQQVAETFIKNHKLVIKPSVARGEAADPKAKEVEISIDASRSHHYLDNEVQDKLRFEPDLKHLAAIYGDKADYFMVSCHLTEGRDKVFSNESRVVAGDPSENINTLLYDLIQKSADGQIEVLHRGGLTIFDRQDLNGNPDNLLIAKTADWHLTSRGDNFEKQIIKRGDKNLYIKLNNPNANLAALLKWGNQQHRKGKLDAIFVLGDDVDANSRSHEKANRLKESNDYILAKMIDSSDVPIFIIPGNHDDRPEEHPSPIKPGDYNLTKGEAQSLEERYNGDLVSLYLFAQDAINSIMASPDALIGYSYAINPFFNYTVNLGRGRPNDPDSRETHFIFLNTGPDDLAHFRQDDPIYRNLQWWPWQFPFTHLQSVVESIRQGTPDMVGLNEASLAWLGRQVDGLNVDVHIGAHAPLFNSKKHPLRYDPSAPITPLKEAINEDLTFGTTAHPDPMTDIVVRSPNVLSYTGGHTHIPGNAYVVGTDNQNNLHIYRGRALEQLDRLPKNDPQILKDFWHPHEACQDGCPESFHDLFEGVTPNLHNSKMVWQAGSAGMGASPNFTVETITPDGFIGPRKTYYVGKKLLSDPNDESLMTVQRIITGTQPDNKKLLAQWESLKKQKEREGIRLKLNMTQDLAAIEDRLSTDDTSFLPHNDASKEYPRYDQTIRDPFVSPTKMNDHLKLRLHGVGLINPDFGPLDAPTGVSAEYLFSQDQVGPIIRALFLEGVQLGWTWQGEGNEFYAAARTPAVVDWKLSDHLILRGINFSFGLKGRYAGGQIDFAPHNDMNVFEANIHFKSLELALGVDRANIFVGGGHWSWFTAVDVKF